MYLQGITDFLGKPIAGLFADTDRHNDIAVFKECQLFRRVFYHVITCHKMSYFAIFFAIFLLIKRGPHGEVS